MGGIPRARENIICVFSSSWQRVLVGERVKEQEVMRIVQGMLVQRGQRKG